MRRCVYAGSFDPITNGHVWMVEQGARLFDRLVVAVGVNPEKKYALSLADRVALLREAIRPHRNATVAMFENQFLVDYARSVKAGYILRGIRSQADFEYERGMRHINEDVNAGVVTVFLIPPREIAEISSSVVKGLVGPKGWERVVRRYVPKGVVEKFRAIHAREERLGSR